MTQYSVKRPYTVLVGVVLVLVLGFVSFAGLSSDLLPSMDLPYVVVMTTYPGAGPEKVEVSVTRPLEQAVATTSGLEDISSISRENVSLLILQFSQSVNMDTVMLDLSNNMSLVTGNFDSMVGTPTAIRINPDMLPIQVLSVDADGMNSLQLTQLVNDLVKPSLERVDGVATVDVSGAVTQYVEIRLNTDKIDAVNDEILKHVDSSLYDAKKELQSAQAKLTDGKNQLTTQRDNAYTQLSDAAAQLDAGQAQAQAIASEKTRLEAVQKVQEGELALVQARAGLVQVQPLFAGLTAMGIPGDTTQDTLLAMSNPNPAFLQIKTALQGLIEAGTLSGEDTIDGAAAKIDATIAGVDAQLQQMGVDPTTATAADIQTKLDSTAADLAEATLLANGMADTLQKLQDGYAQLQQAQMTAVGQIAVAEMQLNDAQSKLDAGKTEYENARDSALKSANIDSLVTQTMLSNILSAQNFSMPAGYVDSNGGSITVKVGDEFATLDEVQNLLLVDMGIEGMAPIRLCDVADVSVSNDAGDSYAHINGNSGIILSLQKSSTASTTAVTKAVNKAVATLTENNSGIHVTTLMDQGVYINMVVQSVLQNFIYGGIIALIILLLFLRDIRPTAIIGISIPISLLTSIVLMYFSGVTLNIISLSGLALGVGMLVDNSVVVIENTYRLRALGVSARDAAVQGAKQVSGAIFASTLTTICVFLPIVFTEGISRQLFTDMGLTIGYSLLASLVVALTIVPALSASLMRTNVQRTHKWFDKLVNGYAKLLDKNLRHKWVVLTAALALLVFSVVNVFNMPLSYIPSMDSTQMEMTLTLDKDATDDELIAASEDIATRVETLSDVDTVGMMTSSGGGMSILTGGGSGGATMSFYVVLKEDKAHTNDEIKEEIVALTPEYTEQLSITTSNMDMSALGGSGISIVIKGDNLDTLQATAVEIGNILRTVDGIAEVTDGSEDQDEELRIIVNKTDAMTHGLTVAQAYQKVAEALQESTTATTLTLDGNEINAVVYADNASTITRESLSSLVVATEIDEDGEDTNITLGEIATLSTAQTPKAINRDNQSRTATVSATLTDGYNVSLVTRDAEAAMANYTAPAGYSFEFTGENESIMSAMTDLLKMVALACVFIYLIMVAQFQSLLSPFIVIFTIPLAFTGGLLALQILGIELSIVSMIGFLVLSGVVVNNGIVFVDYVNQLRLGGMEKREALLQTGRDRIRPILMTASTTIFAMSTMALGVGMGADMSQGMAVVTIGGLAYATLLTLFVVPSLYDILFRRELKKETPAEQPTEIAETVQPETATDTAE